MTTSEELVENSKITENRLSFFRVCYLFSLKSHSKHNE